MFKQKRMSRFHASTSKGQVLVLVLVLVLGEVVLTTQCSLRIPSVHPCYEILMFMIITAANSLVMGLTSLMLQEGGTNFLPQLNMVFTFTLHCFPQFVQK